MNPVAQNHFPNELFECYFDGNTTAPLVVSPRVDVDLIGWAKTNQARVANAIIDFGAVVFSGFNLTRENFSEAFTVLSGMPPQLYKGDTPRDEVNRQIYKSTAVANAHTIPLHQEVSGGNRRDMPKYISFFCVTPPENGTGQLTA